MEEISKKDVLSIVIAGVLLVGIILLLCTTHSDPSFNEKNVGREVHIGWSEVNVRTGYSTSKSIITSLHFGNTVTLTGYEFEYFGGDSKRSTEDWVQVKLENGTIGWIVRDAVNWR